MIPIFSRWLLHKLISSVLLFTLSACNQLDYSVLPMPIQPRPNCKIVCSFSSDCNSSLPGLAVEIIEKCHPNYTNLEIIKKCRYFVDSDFIQDHSLFAPITCAKKNITYWNIYCGICNFEKELNEFEFWSPSVSCKLQRNQNLSDNSSVISPLVVTSVNGSEVLNGLRIDGERRYRLTSVFNNSTYDCNISRSIPKHLKIHVPNCIYSESELQSQMSTKVIRASIFNHFQNQTQFCSAANDSEMEYFCDYRDEYGDICSVNLFLNQSKDNNSVCNSDGYIWLSSLDTDKGAWNQCSNETSKKNTIYVCGPVEASIYKKIKRIIFETMDYLSTFLLFLYLVITSNKQNLRSLPKRIFYSYSWSLWALYICQFISKHFSSCVIKYYIFFYIWQSHSFWILITSFDLWRIVHDSLKLKRICVEGQKKRFLVYCFLGWGLPAVFLAVLYPSLEDVQKSWSCPLVTGFQNQLTCFSKCELNKYTYNFGWITIAIFLVIAPCLLVLTCVFVCLSKRNRARSNVNRTYTIALLKVAVMMGLHWMLLVYLTLFDSGEKFNVVYEFISSFHGSFIFLAFGLEKSTLNTFSTLVLKSSTDEQTQCTSVTQDSQEMKSIGPGKSVIDAGKSVEKT